MVRKEEWSLVRGSFPWKQVGEGVRKSGQKRGVVLGQWFISMATGRGRCQKKWAKKRGGPWSGVHFHRNRYGKVSEKVAHKLEWLLVRGSFPWKQVGEGVGKSNPKRGV